MTPTAATRLSSWGAILLALAVFAVYCATLAPGLTGGDSGELICAAATLGVAHPPGYPLWTLLGHLFSWLPFSSVAWRLNLFSAVCGAAAAGFLCRVIQTWTGEIWAGICAAGLFAFSPLAWEYSRQAEVFALNNLLLALVLFTATRFAIEPSPRNTFFCALACGLALAHHQTAAFLVGPTAVWVCVRLLMSAEGRARRLLAATAGAVLGLSPYLYLPLAARFSSAWSWGDCDTWNGFLTHLLRREYGTFQLASGEAAGTTSLWLVSRYYVADTFPALAYAGLPLAVLGITALIRRNRWRDFYGLGWTVVAALALYLLGFFSLVNLPPGDSLLGGVLARFWMMPDLLFALFAGVGFAVLMSAARGIPWLAPSVAIGLVAGTGALHTRTLSPSSNLIAAYGRAILEPLPENSVLLVRGDLPANAIRYVQTIEHFRTNVAVLNLELLTRRWYVRQARVHYPTLNFPGQIYHPGVAYGFTFAALIEANNSTHSFWLYPDPKPGDPTVAEFSFWPRGFAQEIRATNAAMPDVAAWEQAESAELKKLHAQFAAAVRFAPGTWERVVGEDYWSADHRRAYTLLRLAFADPDNRNLLTQACDAYERFLAECPVNAWYAWKNLGLIYGRLAVTEPEAQSKQVAAWQKYLALAPTNDPDRAAISEFLRHDR